ncbi:MAG: hypothetical protein ABL890_04520 [Candidatus Peribacteraceae bacterium]
MRTLLLLSAFLLAVVAETAAAQELYVYCSNLPGCGSGWKEYITGALVVLLLRLPVYTAIFGVLFLMIGGAYMVMSAGNSERVEKGKKTITWAIIGIFVMNFSVQMVGFVFDETDSRLSGGDLFESIGFTLQSSIFDLLYVALLGIAIFSGMWMVVARGKEDEFQKAYMGLFWAAVGAIIINLADAISSAILTL